MARQIRDQLPASVLRLAFLLGVAGAALTGTLATPASAANHPTSQGNEAQGNKAGGAPVRQLIADREHGREEHHDGYHHGHEYYNGPPPVVYAPPGYYQQPGVQVYFGLPIVQ